VDATYRASAIDQAYEKVRDIERGTVTPAMKRIEAEDPKRHLTGLEFRLKERDRLAEKAANHLKSNPELSYDKAVSKVKDATLRDERNKLQEFQRQVSAEIPVPRDVSDIREYP
jgi:hypothetical protein